MLELDGKDESDLYLLSILLWPTRGLPTDLEFRLNDEALRFISLESGVGRSCQVLIDKLSLLHRYSILNIRDQKTRADPLIRDWPDSVLTPYPSNVCIFSFNRFALTYVLVPE